MNLQTPGERNFRFLVSVSLAFVAGASITEAVAGGCITRECTLLSIGWGAAWGAGFGVISSMQNRVCAEYEHKNAASLEDTQPVKVKSHPIDNRGDLSPLQRNTYTVSVQDGNTLKIADLSACYEFHHPGDKSKHVNGLVAAEAFMDHIKRGGQISNRRCEAMCGGRDSYVAMRDKCVRLGLIVKTANGYHPANVRNN